ncbi:MAG: hypothetical protein WAU69_08100 [Solirubrobacteraceae bacterium]
MAVAVSVAVVVSVAVSVEVTVSVVVVVVGTVDVLVTVSVVVDVVGTVDVLVTVSVVVDVVGTVDVLVTVSVVVDVASSVDVSVTVVVSVSVVVSVTVVVVVSVEPPSSASGFATPASARVVLPGARAATSWLLDCGATAATSCAGVAVNLTAPFDHSGELATRQASRSPTMRVTRPIICTRPRMRRRRDRSAKTRPSAGALRHPFAYT